MSQNRKGITHARGFCPVCGRDIAGGVDHSDGRVVLRRHKRPRPLGEAARWCAGGGTKAPARAGR